MSHEQTAPDKKRLIMLVVIALVGSLAAAGIVYQLAGSASDASYDKSAENPILPPGVRPGQSPPPGPGGSK